MTELWKNIEIQGRNWAIKKIDAQLGAFYAYQLMEKSAPDGSDNRLQNMKPNRPVMGKAEFLEMQRDFLNCCFEVLPAGKTPIFNENGSYAVQNIEYNAPLLQLLYLNSFSFSLADFFVGSHLNLMVEAMTGLLPQDPQTSPNGNNSSSSQ